ncbi:ribonucleases P/MRP protein subunit POP1-domain-containing protein, partial [Protomyces lactucae-debilis]
MGVKRAREEPLSAGVHRKRQRNRDARSIATQSASQSLRQGALPIQDFLNARRFEIRALRDSMRKSRESSVQRAFQSLPRYLRRRAASHNPKRVPKRLRSRARAEIDDADGGASKNKRVPFKRKRGRRETIRKLAQLRERKVEEQTERLEGTPLPAFKATEGGRFCKRQRNKTWLPSHLWTSKRAHMLTRWGYALPQSPNEKTYRSTHRASKAKGVIIFDTSYMCTLILQGRAAHIASLLDDLTRSKEAGGLRARRGTRAVEAHAFNKTYLCPISVLWDGSSTDTHARVQLRLHPTAFASVWQVLVLMRKEKQLYLVRIIDARFSLGSIELVGPMAINTLLTVLKSNADDEHTRVFKSLHGLLPKEVPANVVLPLLVRDSRRQFPPRPITEPAKSHNKHLNEWPIQGPSSQLFLVDQIDQCNRSRPSQSDIDKSKSELPNDTIPVLLTRTRLGFCLQAPWATITDFWYSFNHIPHVRFGGVQEYKQVHYESSVPHFPTDFPGTHAGNAEAKHLRDELQVAHLRRPPAKRQNWDKSIDGKPELGDPFACDWYFL